mgnify:CR=1 FL=1|tara:strand:- start:3108 stop:3314 length:207 start_codon:yes stop_codon:yes gene_type:complete
MDLSENLIRSSLNMAIDKGMSAYQYKLGLERIGPMKKNDIEKTYLDKLRTELDKMRRWFNDMYRWDSY